MNRNILALVFLLSHLCSATVTTLSQCSGAGGQWARILVSLQNKGPGNIQRPRVAFDLTVPSGLVPEVQVWDGASIAATVERVSATAWTVWLTSSIDLLDGKTWGDGRGILFGIHLNDWRNWTAAASPSWSRDSTKLVENTTLRVYDASGRLISTVVPPISTKSSFQIQLDPGGVCNLNGNVVVNVGNTLSLRCQPNTGMLWSGWDLDAITHPITKIMDVPADGKDHIIRVHFQPRTRFWVSVSVLGSGVAQPNGDVAVYQGDSIAIAATANAGAVFTGWSVNGVSQGTGAILVLKNIQAATAVVAEFKPMPPGVGIKVLLREELPRDPKWSKIRIKVKNTGVINLDAGYVVDYIFRVPKYQIPTLSLWDVPSATTKLTDLGTGYWKVRITSSASLSPGAESGDGRGWYFALQTGADINWDVTGNIALPAGAGADWSDAPLVSVYDRNGARVTGSDPYLSAGYPDGVQLMALFKEDAGDDKMLRPRVILRNLGDQAVSDFVYYYYFRTDSAKVPVVTPWFPSASIPALEALGNGHYRLRYDYTGSTLPPHTDLPTPDGSVTGVYLPGFPLWNKSTACSYMPGNVFQPDSAILVYGQGGKLIWGKPGAVKACGGVDTNQIVDSTEWILYPPVIVYQPRDSTVRAGQSVRFEARATGEGVLRYQWRWNGANIVGAVGPILDLALVGASQNGDEFSCVISNPAGTTVSRKARLTVTETVQPAYILLQPEDDTVALGDDASFRVLVSGGGNLRYQWVHNGIPMPSQTGSRLVVRGVTVRDSGSYQVRITTANGQQLVSRLAALVFAAQQPTNMMVTVSGTFVDSMNQVGPDSTADLVVRLFATPQGGNPVWSEHHTSVSIRNGDWNLTIGRSRTSPTLSEIVSKFAGLYLEVALDGAVPVVFGPRVPLTSVPYAMSSGARVIYGQGAPVQPALEGVLYLDQIDQRLWQRKSSVWNRLDP